MKNAVKIRIGLGIGLLLLIQTTPCLAQVVSNNFFDSFMGQYANAAQGWEAPLRRFALSIFGMLALMDIVWLGKELIVNKESFSDWGLALLQKFVVLGFFYALLTHSSEYAFAMIQSFRLAGEAANNAAGGMSGMQPSNIFDAGMNMAGSLIQALSWTRLSDNILMITAAIIVAISFALIAALQGVALLESYVFTYAGIIFLGFGGSFLTRDIAKRFLMSLLAVGTKLFVIQLIIGLGVIEMRKWSAAVQADTSVFNSQLVIQILGGSVVFLTFAKIVPEFVQSMISGAAFSNGRAMFTSALSTASMATAVTAGTAAGFTGALSGLTKSVGLDGVSSHLGNASKSLGQTASRSAEQSLNHGFDMHTNLSQFMPSGNSKDQKWKGPVPMRGEGSQQGVDYPDRSSNREDNSISN